ncbi:MAG: EAL domain-containing protein [Acidimicrobiales bacterium]|nr:EAL domain-containing protein [Acidimicrobiales bacterium]
MSDTFGDTATRSTDWGSLIDQSSIATGIADEFTLRRVNPALCALVDRTIEDVAGRDLRDFVHPDDRSMVDDIERKLAGGGDSASVHVRIVRPDGRPCHVSVEVVVLERPGRRRFSEVLVQAVDLTDLYQARMDNAASGRRFSKLLTNARDIVSVLDAEGVMRYSTATNVGALGFPSDFWEGWRPLESIHPDDRPAALIAWDEVLAKPGEAIDVEVRMPSADGHWADLVLTGVNLLDDPDVQGVVMTARNVSQLRQSERIASCQAAVLELIARSAPASEIFDRCIDLLQVTGRGGRSAIFMIEDGVLDLHAAEGLTGGEAALEIPMALGAHVLAEAKPEVTSDVTVDSVDEGLRAALTEAGVKAFWAHPVYAHGSSRPVGACCTVFDHVHQVQPEETLAAELASKLVSIAIDHIDAEAQLAHQALHDALTGLPNRTLLLDRLDHALARRDRTGSKVAVLFCDLDRFKVVNDSLGHGVGDQLLIAAAQRLEATLSPGDTVARFGGDEFVVLLEDVSEEQDAVEVADRISAALARPFELPGGQDVYLTTSIGIAFAIDHGSGDGWLRDADAAMYKAKEQGRDQLVVFDTAMRDAAMERLQVEHDLRRGLDRGELVVHYLPTVDLTTGRIVGGEALVRWHHPVRGLLSPGEFVPVAEETGVIDELGRRVLDVATRDIAVLLDSIDVESFLLGVNISARQIASGDVVGWVSEICRRNRWPLECLLLEVTETALSRGVIDPAQELDRVTELGVRLAIDDFGTGHSSLTRLGQLPVSQVKVDRSFVSAIGSSPDRSAASGSGQIVDAVVALARAMDLRTCAEGVESGEQLDHLRRLGCHYAQGYLFSEPLPIEQFKALVKADPRW